MRVEPEDSCKPAMTSNCSSKEYETLRELFPDFVETMQDDLDGVAGILFAEKLIDKSLLLSAEGEKAGVRATRIMIGVLRIVEFKPKSVYRFTEALKMKVKGRLLIDACDKLETRLGRISVIQKNNKNFVDDEEFRHKQAATTISKKSVWLLVCVLVLAVAVMFYNFLWIEEEDHSIFPSFRDFSAYPVECQNDMYNYAASLMTCYREMESTDDKLNFVSTKYYVPLVIVKSESIDRYYEADKITLSTLHGGPDDIMKVKEPLELTGLFKPTSKKRLKFILVSGAPGIGKSTLALEIARDWKKLSNHSLAILVRLREKKSQTASHVDDLYIEKDSVNMSNIKKCVSKTEGKGVLWILDGFDELPIDQQQESESVYHRLFKKSDLPLSTVIVTSRPSVKTELTSYLSNASKHVEIVGFNSTQIESYVNHSFKTEPEEMLSNFTVYYSKSPTIKSLMKIPLNAAIVTFVFKKGFHNHMHYPNTLTELYSSLVCALIRRHQEGRWKKDLIPHKLMTAADIQQLPSGIQNSFYYLTELAFYNIIKDKYIFSNLGNSFDHLGLMNKDSSLSIAVKPEYTYNFLHTTLQEYMAAIYVSQKTSLVNKVYNRKVILTFLFGISAYMNETSNDSFDTVNLSSALSLFHIIVTAVQKVFCYFSFIVGSTACSINLNMNKTALESAYFYSDVKDRLQFLYEFPTYKPSNNVLGTLNLYSYDEHLIPYYRLSDYYIAGHLIAHFNVSLYSVVLKCKFLEEIEMFLNGLYSISKQSLYGMGKISVLLIVCWPTELRSNLTYSTVRDLLISNRYKKHTLIAVGYVELLDLVPNSVFKEVDFIGCHDESIPDLSKIVHHNKTMLTGFSVNYGTPAGEVVSDELLKPLFEPSAIETLQLSQQNLSNVSQGILSLVAHNRNIKTLIFRECKLISEKFLHASLSNKNSIDELDFINSSVQKLNYNAVMKILFSSSIPCLGIAITSETDQSSFTALQYSRTIWRLRLRINFFENMSLYQSVLASAIESKDNALKELIITFDLFYLTSISRITLHNFFLYLSQLVLKSTPPLSSITIEEDIDDLLRTTDNLDDKLTQEHIVMLLKAARRKPYPFAVKLGAFFYSRLPFSYTKYAQIEVHEPFCSNVRSGIKYTIIMH